MNLPKAIEILTEHPYRGVTILSPEFQEATKLLIEAGKRLDYCRSGEFNEPFELLPGETKD